MVRRRKEQGADLIKIFAREGARRPGRRSLTEQLHAPDEAAGRLRSRCTRIVRNGAAARRLPRARKARRTQADIDAARRALHQPAGRPWSRTTRTARYVGIGTSPTKDGDHGARPATEICTIAVHTPGAKVFNRRHAAHGRNAEELDAQHWRADADGGARVSELTRRGGDRNERSHRSLAPGYEADIIALDGDPLTDLTPCGAWCSCDGRWSTRAGAKPPRSPPRGR